MKLESIDGQARIPRQGLVFAAPVTMAAAADGERGRRFSGVAYGGGVITDHAWWDAVAFDLSGVTANAPMPLLLQHDHDRQIGVIEQVQNDGRQLAIEGRLFTGIDADADRVAAKADAGAPWQMSIGIFPDRIEEIAPGHVVTINGREIIGSAHVFRAARVREASFVALGADPTTRANVFTSGGDVIAKFDNAKEPPMADTDHADQIAAITAERDAEKERADKAAAALAELQGKFAALERAEREAAVKELLGDEFTAEKAAPFMDMTPAQFAAVQASHSALRSKLPPGFTAEQASAGSHAAAITPEAINKFRRDNPGATYEHAFAALKSPGSAALPTTFAG